jgi:hypothetical protein
MCPTDDEELTEITMRSLCEAVNEAREKLGDWETAFETVAEECEQLFRMKLRVKDYRMSVEGLKEWHRKFFGELLK